VKRFLALVVATVAILSSCASEPAAPGQLVRITLSEFAFSPKDITLKAGQLVTLELRNRGQLQHEVMAGTGVPEHEGYPSDLFTGVAVTLTGTSTRDHAHRGFAIIVGAGKTARATFTVPEQRGVYEIGCFELGHYASGMVGRLVIE
jgi:uncharacterized cupredoxin-like copper-binding protein